MVVENSVILSCSFVYIYMRASFWASVTLTTVSGLKDRRLIIEGQTAEVSEYPFVVSLMYCKYAVQGLSCASYCSGSLIAPDVVLTAGHCVFNEEDSGFNHTLPAVPLSNMYALVGADDWQSLQSGSRLVRVSSVANAGYGMNKRYPMDDDLGLVFLSECVEELPGRISYVPIATRATEKSNQSQCSFITSLGFGTHSNVPSEIFSHDGKLRVLLGDTLHSHSTCSESYMDALRRADAEPEELDLAIHEIDEDKHLCAGGDTVASTCFGDSGGPVVMDDAVIGVTSFGPFSVCMASPDYIARVSTYAEWIRDMIETNSKKCRPVDRSFTSWPLPIVETHPIGRCGPNEWQCAESAECIPVSSVCDRKLNCQDGSDEDPYFCRIEFIKFPFGRRSERLVNVGLKEDLGSALRSADRPSKADRIEDEFNQLVFGASEHLKFFSNGKALGGGHSQVRDQDVAVSVVGMLFSVSGRTRGLRQMRLRSSQKSTEPPQSDSCGAELERVEQDLMKCNEEIKALAVQLDYEAKYGENRFAYEPAPVVSRCSAYKACIEGNAGGSFSTWFAVGNQCVMETEHELSALVAGQWGLVQFCGATVEEFITVNATKVSYADSFSKRFGEPTCQFPLDAGRKTAGGTTKSSGSLSVYSIRVALCILLLQQWL
jgi:secreted trypsin-like serine protease